MAVKIERRPREGKRKRKRERAREREREREREENTQGGRLVLSTSQEKAIRNLLL